jgi:hypothetical protein
MAISNQLKRPQDVEDVCFQCMYIAPSFKFMLKTELLACFRVIQTCNVIQSNHTKLVISVLSQDVLRE